MEQEAPGNLQRAEEQSVEDASVPDTDMKRMRMGP